MRIGRQWPRASRVPMSGTFSTASSNRFPGSDRPPRGVNFHSEMLTRLDELSDHRRLRLLSAGSKVPPLLWAVLIIGALITVGFSYFLGVEGGRAHALMTAALAAMIALTLYLIFAINRPFAGTLRVTPEAFRIVLQKV